MRFLCIEDGDGKLSFQFLKRLPSLQYLQLKVSPFPGVWDWSTYNQDEKLINMKEVEEGRLYDTKIWKELPQLEAIFLQTDKVDELTQFHRKGYEQCLKSEKKSVTGGIKEEDYPLGQDILEFLEINVAKNEQEENLMNRLNNCMWNEEPNQNNDGDGEEDEDDEIGFGWISSGSNEDD